jgi:hypothetical protein
MGAIGGWVTSGALIPSRRLSPWDSGRQLGPSVVDRFRPTEEHWGSGRGHSEGALATLRFDAGAVGRSGSWSGERCAARSSQFRPQPRYLGLRMSRCAAAIAYCLPLPYCLSHGALQHQGTGPPRPPARAPPDAGAARALPPRAAGDPDRDGARRGQRRKAPRSALDLAGDLLRWALRRPGGRSRCGGSWRRGLGALHGTGDRAGQGDQDPGGAGPGAPRDEEARPERERIRAARRLQPRMRSPCATCPTRSSTSCCSTRRTR